MAVLPAELKLKRNSEVGQSTIAEESSSLLSKTAEITPNTSNMDLAGGQQTPSTSAQADQQQPISGADKEVEKMFVYCVKHP